MGQIHIQVSGLSIRGGTRYFYPHKLSLSTPDFKEYCIRYSWKCSNFNKILPVNSEVLVELKVVRYYSQKDNSRFTMFYHFQSNISIIFIHIPSHLVKLYNIHIFLCLKWSLVPPDFKECCNRFMKVVQILIKSTIVKYW